MFKLSISVGKLEIKMRIKKFYVRIFKSGFWKSGCHGNGLIGMDLVNVHTIVFPDKFYEKSSNFIAVHVAVFVVKIQIFEISAG